MLLYLVLSVVYVVILSSELHALLFGMILLLLSLITLARCGYVDCGCRVVCFFVACAVIGIGIDVVVGFVCCVGVSTMLYVLHGVAVWYADIVGVSVRCVVAVLITVVAWYRVVVVYCVAIHIYYMHVADINCSYITSIRIIRSARSDTVYYSSITCIHNYCGCCYRV